MRLTQVLLEHNKHRLFKFKWEIAKRSKLQVSPELKNMTKLGVPLTDAKEYLEEIIENDIVKKEPEVVPFVEKLGWKIPMDENHPLFKPQTSYCLGDKSILLKDIEQAKCLLNMVQIREGLPESVENIVGDNSIPIQDPRVQRSIMFSHVYDSMQVKLPKRKDPARLQWNFPRDYGIDNNRKFQLLINQFLQLCDLCPDGAPASDRSFIGGAYCNAHLSKDGSPLELQAIAGALITSNKPLACHASRDSGNAIELPNLYPLKSTISIPMEHFYHGCSIFPLSSKARNSHPHTAIIHFNPSEIRNIYEEPVTDMQFLARTLTQAFTVAASQAQQLYGDDVKELPEPVTLQVVHTDLRQYHFAILQLNTLDLSECVGQKNIFWMLPKPINLYSVCGYVKGRPTLDDYNPEVFQRLLAFYHTA